MRLFFKYVLAITIFPVAFIITLPVEFPLWMEFKKQRYNVPSYFKFFWYRCMMLNDKSYKKI